ncbi:molybdate ABC transporter substrate-binding protein [Bowmanella yangjiangensis]|uniref:Molybdate ABC transporter substrate-binding protein n=1 Tax=Bowmanella yangjiangensis TaxID=2811230 RepID=A0ABS3CYE2_9ALTE|nr:molybdate ABC transporter substrate-binding protein [Bowmanella yangjiangensis]MBN7822148.1 molybdate ABC transporter substrate-binding protein [Bowmanella yangjiangensis]
MKISMMGILALMSLPLAAEPLNLAVASNFAAPMQAIIKGFEEKTGQQVRMSLGASGKFVAQIHHGAPFDIFFSADQAKPLALLEAGYGASDTVKTYAIGSLALWSANPDTDVRQQLQQASFRKLALANPKLAPYGSAAVSVLQQLNLVDATQSKWVQGENIAQTFQFVQSGNAELGFVALSQLIGKAQNARNLWIIPTNLYPAIRQDRVVLKKSAQKPAVKAFLDYLQQAQPRQIITKHGYALPEEVKNAL